MDWRRRELCLLSKLSLLWICWMCDNLLCIPTTPPYSKFNCQYFDIVTQVRQFFFSLYIVQSNILSGIWPASFSYNLFLVLHEFQLFEDGLHQLRRNVCTSDYSGATWLFLHTSSISLPLNVRNFALTSPLVSHSIDVWVVPAHILRHSQDPLVRHSRNHRAFHEFVLPCILPSPHPRDHIASCRRFYRKHCKQFPCFHIWHTSPQGN